MTETLNRTQRREAKYKRPNRVTSKMALIVRNPVYQAYAALPMSESLQTIQAIDARMAFDAACSGQASRDDRETLAGVANCIVVLAEKHCDESDLLAAQDAQKAILRADARVIDGAAVWNFDGEGRRAILAALDAFEQMVAAIGFGAVSEALLTILERTASWKIHKMMSERADK